MKPFSASMNPDDRGQEATSEVAEGNFWMCVQVTQRHDAYMHGGSFGVGTASDGAMVDHIADEGIVEEFAQTAISEMSVGVGVRMMLAFQQRREIGSFAGNAISS
jgi:hypothetical protein